MSKTLAKWISLESTTLKDDGSGNVKVFLDASGKLVATVNGIAVDPTYLATLLLKDGSVSMTGDLNMGTHKITNVVAGVSSNDVVTVSQLQSAIAGLTWKAPADEAALAPTGNQVGKPGWRVLINGTGTGLFASHNNTIATWDGTVWTFETPTANWAVFVKTSDSSYTYDLDTIAWVQFSGAGTITAGSGLIKTDNVLDVGQKNGDGSSVAGGAIQVNADSLEVKVDGSTLEITNVSSQPGVIRVKDLGITAGKIDKSGTFDFASAGGVVQVATQTAEDSSTKAASTAFVAAATSGMSKEKQYQETFLISAGDQTNGYVTLSKAPANVRCVALYINKGLKQINKDCVDSSGASPDFQAILTSGNRVYFRNVSPATGLTQDIGTGDTIIIEYTSNS